MESLCSGKSSYRFGAFELNPQTGELSNAGKKSQLRDQPLKLLLALLEQPGELVPREVLVRRLWPEGTFVDFDRGLNKAVLHLREALADSAEHPQFIETLPRKGYRFVAPLARDAQESPTVPLRDTKSLARFYPWTVALAAVACLVIVILANVGGARDWISNRSHPTSQITALAVIPLENLSGNPDQEYFADGMHPQSLLCYEMYGQRLTREHGAPLRLNIPTKIGYKQAKYLTDLKVSHVLERVGYWEDQGYSEFYGL